MNLVTRRAKDAFVRQKASEGFFLDAGVEEVCDLVVEIAKRYYSRQYRIHDVWLYVWKTQFRYRPSISSEVSVELTRRQRQRSLDLKIEPEYYI